MINRVKARSFANIALIKYWGKADDENNIPATPSLSLSIDALKTETEISLTDDADSLTINGKKVSGKALEKTVRLIDRWRELNNSDYKFRIDSFNSFPDEAGLASSASGISALVTGLNRFADKPMDISELSRLARFGSGSSARSITGGISILRSGGDYGAEQVLAPDEIPWGMVIAIIDSGKKEIDSRAGMKLSEQGSPYFDAWIKQCHRDFEDMLEAVPGKDLEVIGELMETNTLAMHSCMMAGRPPLFYWKGGTVSIINRVKAWRKDGIKVYFTIDAGPNLILLGYREDLDRISSLVKEAGLADDVVVGMPAGVSEIVE